MNKLTQKFHIPCYFTDASWRLKPASFMNLAQEAATQHATILGFGYDELIVSRTAWIISRMHIEFVDTPKWREQMTLQTWHKGLERLFFLRDFIMTDSEGKARVKATTSWQLKLEMRLSTFSVILFQVAPLERSHPYWWMQVHQIHLWRSGLFHWALQLQ